ncbi:MAG: hypothetical protein U9O20_03935 [Patescibacteria group bacterium]|nr:hypothetical protein [Patescibacteria group bacterium]
MKRISRNVWLVLAIVLFVAMISGCATTNQGFGSPQNLMVMDKEPVLVMQGEFDGIKIIHRVAVYEGKKVKLLDWTSENVVDADIEHIYFEVGLEVNDKIMQVFVKRIISIINEKASDWIPLEPLELKNSFRVKLPSDKGQREFSLKLRFVRSEGEDQILPTKKMKCNFI